MAPVAGRLHPDDLDQSGRPGGVPAPSVAERVYQRKTTASLGIGAHHHRARRMSAG